MLNYDHEIAAVASVAGYNTPMEMIMEWAKPNLGVLRYPEYPYVWIYQKLLFGKLEVNEGMFIENIVAQMLTASGNKLFFYSKSSEQAEERMEIDFLLQKDKVTSRHNIRPLEVKSGKNYTLSSLTKCMKKFGEYMTTPTVLHAADYKVEDGITYLPLYMTSLL